MKKFIPQLPSYILSAGFGILGIIDLMIDGIRPISLILIGIGLLFLLQERFKLWILTVISSFILMLICGYFFLALFSDYTKIDTLTRPLLADFIFGFLLIGGTGALALYTHLRGWFMKP